MSDSGALVGLLTTVITVLLGAVGWLYRENRTDTSARVVLLRAERDEWKAVALELLQHAERGVVATETALSVAKENGP